MYGDISQVLSNIFLSTLPIWYKVTFISAILTQIIYRVKLLQVVMSCQVQLLKQNVKTKNRPQTIWIFEFSFGHGENGMKISNHMFL